MKLHKDVQKSVNQFKDNINQAFIVEHIEIHEPKWYLVDAETKAALKLEKLVKSLQ